VLYKEVAMTLFQSCFQMACYTRPVPMFAALTAIITALCVSGRSEGLQTAGMMIIFLAAGFAAQDVWRRRNNHQHGEDV
tara:strand:+ start:1413 stop:1649 length:237 start_codon:yes stop_codon:yes gene_type:complete